MEYAVNFPATPLKSLTDESGGTKVGNYHPRIYRTDSTRGRKPFHL